MLDLIKNASTVRSSKGTSVVGCINDATAAVILLVILAFEFQFVSIKADSKTIVAESEIDAAHDVATGATLVAASVDVAEPSAVAGLGATMPAQQMLLR